MITDEVSVLMKLFVPVEDSLDATGSSNLEKYESETIDFVYTPLGKLINSKLIIQCLIALKMKIKFFLH